MISNQPFKLQENEWMSKAEWPQGSVVQKRANDITTDFHFTESAAKAVCRMLERDGLGGEGKIFPVRTWVEPIDKTLKV